MRGELGVNFDGFDALGKEYCIKLFACVIRVAEVYGLVMTACHQYLAVEERVELGDYAHLLVVLS